MYLYYAGIPYSILCSYDGDDESELKVVSHGRLRFTLVYIVGKITGGKPHRILA